MVDRVSEAPNRRRTRAAACGTEAGDVRLSGLHALLRANARRALQSEAADSEQEVSCEIERSEGMAATRAQSNKERRALAPSQTETCGASELLRHHGQHGEVPRL